MNHQTKTLSIFFIVLTAILVYTLIPKSDSLKENIVPVSLKAWSKNNSGNQDDNLSDNLSANSSTDGKISSTKTDKNSVDSTAQRLLFFGDSMLETLGKRAADYALANGHDIHTVVWYSSTSQHWAQTDTLEYFLNLYKPTFAVISLCGNELFVKDLENRERYIKQIINKLGNTPFVWISPPNWKDDSGINEVIVSCVGKNRYFDSTHYRERMKRKKDGAHPTQDAANWWMDSIADFMNSTQSAHPILMQRPDTTARQYNMTLLQPTNI